MHFVARSPTCDSASLSDGRGIARVRGSHDLFPVGSGAGRAGKDLGAPAGQRGDLGVDSPRAQALGDRVGCSPQLLPVLRLQEVRAHRARIDRAGVGQDRVEPQRVDLRGRPVRQPDGLFGTGDAGACLGGCGHRDRPAGTGREVADQFLHSAPVGVRRRVAGQGVVDAGVVRQGLPARRVSAAASQRSPLWPLWL